MQFTEYNTDIPDWARNAMMMKCRYCGAYIIDNGDESSGHEITSRKCANPKCPGHMSYKIAYLAKYFEIKGVGPATALQLIRDYKLENHLDIIPIWFTKDKPCVRLAVVADLACIEGYGETKATQDLNCYSSFKQYFDNCRNIDPVVWYNRETLYKAEEYFDIAPPLSKQKMYVMMTGSFNGFDNRKDFLNEVNEAFGQIIQVIDAGKRKTGVSYLIKEVSAPNRSKTALAREVGIPIVTPKEFVDILYGLTHN